MWDQRQTDTIEQILIESTSILAQTKVLILRNERPNSLTSILNSLKTYEP